jgi:DNA-binding NtrC family response regulator
MLEQLDHKVQIVGSADSALDMLERGDRFDMVLSDIVMAGRLDGHGLAQVVRERFPDLPVLLATGYSRAIETAGDEFQILRKPYQMLDLSRAIRRLFASSAPAEKAAAAETGAPSNLVDFSAARRNRSPKA